MASTFNITAELNLVNSSNVKQTVNDLQRQLRGVNATVGLNTSGATTGLQNIATGANASRAALRAIQAQASSTTATFNATVSVTEQGASAFRNFSEQAGLAARRFAAFTVAAGAMVTVTRGIQDGVRSAIDFQLAMNKVEQVSDEVSSKLGALRSEIGSLATGFGVSSAALAETAITLKQAGLSIDQTKEALKALALTDLAPTFDGMKQSTEGLIAAFRQFNLSSGQFEQTLSAMNAVAGKFAVESSDIITAVQKAGGAFKASAGDMKSGSEALNEFMALFTSVRATTRESADAIATGLRTVFTRFQRADTVKALQDLGINLRYTREEARALGDIKLADQFVGAYEAVRRLSEGLEGLRETDPRYSQVVEQLGGYRQISRAIPLLKEFKTAEEAKNLAMSGGISLQIAAEKRQESMANRISRLKEEYLELFRSITETRSFQALANSMLAVASAFAKAVDYAKPLLPILVGLAAVKIGANLGGITGGFARAFVAPPGAAVSGKPGAGPLRFASGGYVPGSGNNDTEAALLMPGEFVLNKMAVAKMGVPALRDLNEGRSRFRLQRYETGSREPVGGVTPASDKPAVDSLASAAAKAASSLAKLTDAVGPAVAGRGEALLARLKSRQAPAPKPTDDIQAMSFQGVGSLPTPGSQDVPYVSPAADVRRDSEDATEREREKQARAFFDKQNGATGSAPTSFISQLKTQQQKDFYAKYAVGSGTRPSVAESAGNFHALKSGDIGRAGIASGVVEDAAFEAVAQLAVNPPEGFDPNHKSAQGFVVRHVQNAVRNRLNDEYGKNAKRFGGYVPTDAEGNTVEVAGREQDPSARVDTEAEIASAKAREAERARQLARVKSVLPGGALPTDRAGRISALQAFGEGKTQAVTNAAASRFDAVLAGHVGDALGVTPPGGPGKPTTDFSGPAPGGSAGKVRDGIHRVSFNDLPSFAKSLGLDPNSFSDLSGQVRGATSEAGKTGSFQAGLSDVALSVKNGTFSKVAGVVNNAEVRNPFAAQVEKYVKDFEKNLAPGDAARKSSLTNEERDYQTGQLVAAQQKFGSTFGVAEDDVRSNRRLGRGQARGDSQAFDFEQQRRAESGAFVDPLIAARDSRRQRLEEGRQEERSAAEREGADAAKRALRQSRDAAGIGGITDPTLIKSAAVQAFRDGNAGVLGDNGKGVLDAVKNKLSPAQYAQVVNAAQQAGFVPTQGQPKPASVDLAQLTKNDDGTKTVTGGLLKDRIDKLTDERVAARGGSNNLSDGTKGAIRQQAGVEEEAKVRNELISAQKNLLAKLNPQMSAYERNKKALEDVEKAMQGVAQVAKDQRGKLLGLSATVAQAGASGIDAPGASRAGLLARGSGALSSVGNRLSTPSRLAERADGLLDKKGLSFGLVGAGIGASYLGDRFEQKAGSAEDAARSARGTSDFKANKGIGGALSGAVAGAGVGAAIGSVVPVIGTAIGGLAGAVAGGAAGLYSALADAEKDIRQAKINNALTELGDRLASFASGIPSAENLVGIGKNLDDYDKNSDAKARENATSFFSFRKFEFDSFDSQQYTTERQSNLRKEFGLLIPQVSQGLSKQAEVFGKANPNANLADPKAREQFLKTFGATGGGVNARLIERISQSEKVPASQIQDRIIKAVTEAQRQRRVEDENKAARAASEQQVNTFGRLFQAVQAAADSLYGLQQRASSLTDVLDGNVTASRVSSHSERLSEGLGRLDGGALKPLDIIAAATGGAGASLRASGGGADAVARALPGVLASVSGSKGLNEDNITSRVQESIYRNLGFREAKDAPENIQKAVATVIGGLNESQAGGRGVGGVTDEIRTDASKYAEKLLAGATEPIKEFGGKIAKQLEDNGNRFVDGLTSLHQRLQQVGQLYDQLGQLRTQNFRQNLQLSADDAGRGNQALDFASVGDLEAGTNQRQQRLAGVGGPQAFDPRFLGQQLNEVRTQIGAATERQQATFEKTGGKGSEFGAAAEEVLRLKDRAANLQQALKNLADVSERQAVIQEKLNRLKQEEDGRLGLAERFATADPTEQMRMNQGFLLANQAAQAGNLDGFGSEDRRLIVDTLKSAGGVTLTGFQGSPRADDLLKNLLSNSFGGAFQLTKDQKQERDGLWGEAVNRGRTAEEAVAQLIQHQETGSAELFRNLQQQQTQFFSKLERLLVTMRKQDVENQRARVLTNKGDLETRGVSRDVLAGVGVTSTNQLDALRGRRGELEGLRAAIIAEKSERDKISAAKGRVKEFARNTNPTQESAIQNVLTRSGFDGEQAKRIQDRTLELINSDEYQKLNDEVRSRTARGSAERNRGFDAVDQKALRQALLEEGARDNGKAVRDARDKLNGIAGVDSGKLTDTLRGSNAAALIKALDAFDGSGNKIEDFGSKLSAVSIELGKLEEQLRNLSAAEGATGPVVTRAGGGDIFRPMGTDTVPAMLTPGEFVINARSASANAALLHQINEARGPVYLAGGGVADFDLFAASPFGRTAQRDAQRVTWDRVKKAQDRQRASDEERGAPSGRQALYSQFGGRDAFERAMRQRATDDVAGDLVAAGQIRNFNRQAGVSAGIRRPGDEGQRAIAGRVMSVEDRGFDERWKRDAALRRYTAARVGSQTVQTSQKLANGGSVRGSALRPSAQGLANGGVVVGNVNYLAGGGTAQAGSSGAPVSFSGEAVKAMTDLSSTLAQFAQQAVGFGQAAQQLAQTFNVFAGSAQALTQALSNMPRSLTITGQHQVNVVINGAEVMAKLTPEIQQMITTGVREQLGRAFKEHMPDAGVRL